MPDQLRQVSGFGQDTQRLQVDASTQRGQFQSITGAVKQVVATTTAFPEKVGPLDIVRAVPNQATQAIGPVIFLDHILEKRFAPGEMPTPNGSFAHPHRGIATFSYLLKGAVTHFDSNGGHGTVTAGGVQWMNAGNGIIHDEMLSKELRDAGGDFYAFQFWVNLPAKNKAEAPDYMPLAAEELPVVDLGEGKAVLKVLLGAYNGAVSPIPTFTEQFIWHLHLEAGARIDLPTVGGHEYGGYLPIGRAVVNGATVSDKQFLLFDTDGDGITAENPTDAALDLFVFGGAPYAEPMVAHGPFVMNTEAEIHQAYADARVGKYGRINYHGHLD